MIESTHHYGREFVPKTIVVPLDGSDLSLGAVPTASALAQRFDADIVMMTTPLTADREARDQAPPWLLEAATESGASRVRTMVASDDHAATAIVDLVTGLPDGVVCMGTHGHGRLLSAALGSVAQEVVRTAAIPLVLVGPQCAEEAEGWRGEGQMVVCHDGSAAADAVLGPVRAWSRALGLPITLVHVFHPLDVESAQEPTASIAHAMEFLGQGVSVRVLRDSYPVGAIRGTIEELDPTLVAIGTHGHTGIARIALGSVATAVVRSSSCPVLVARPEHLNDEDRRQA